MGVERSGGLLERFEAIYQKLQDGSDSCSFTRPPPTQNSNSTPADWDDKDQYMNLPLKIKNTFLELDIEDEEDFLCVRIVTAPASYFSATMSKRKGYKDYEDYDGAGEATASSFTG